MATEYLPDDDGEFVRDRQWHYDIHVPRVSGELRDPSVGIRFPCTDLAEVVSRLREFTSTPGSETA